MPKPAARMPSQPTLRYAGFMLKGLAETEASLRDKRIPFRLLRGAEPRGACVIVRRLRSAVLGRRRSEQDTHPRRRRTLEGSLSAVCLTLLIPRDAVRCATDVVPALAREVEAIAVVTDMSPLRDPKRWLREVAEHPAIAVDRRPLFQVGGGDSSSSPDAGAEAWKPVGRSNRTQRLPTRFTCDFI